MQITSEKFGLFTKRFLIAIAIVVISIFLLALLYFAFDILLLAFAAVLLAIFLRGISDYLNRFLKIGDIWSVLLVSVILISVLAGSIVLLAPSVADQMAHLRTTLPQSAENLGEFFSQYGWGRVLLSQMPSNSDIANWFTSIGFLSGVGGIFTQTVGAVGNFLLVILLAIYLAVEPGYYATGITKLFPMDIRSRVKEVLSEVAQTLRWWLVGKAGSMVFIGLLTWIGLSVIGVPLALTLGLIAGLLSFIPNFGPIISAVPAILLAFTASPMTALYVAILYIAIQLIESNLVTPIIERETVKLPPGLTIIFQLALGSLIGGLGLILATPLLAVLLVLIQMIYIQQILGDEEMDTFTSGTGLTSDETEDNSKSNADE